MNLELCATYKKLSHQSRVKESIEVHQRLKLANMAKYVQLFGVESNDVLMDHPIKHEFEVS